MISFVRRFQSRSPAFHDGFLRSIFSSKPAKSVITCLLVIVLLLAIWDFPKARTDNAFSQILSATSEAPAEAQQEVQHSTKGRLHLLVPATSTNADLCKLLVSAQILGYPTPVLINFDDQEDLEDPYKQHLAKVGGFLDYLEQLETSSEYAEDLVLIVDGYDIWFQLPPDVLIKRYYELNGAADNRTRSIYGDAVFEAQDMRQTVIFGPDKLCWPVEYSRPACWAVPEATLPEYAFGPETSRIYIDMFMPRWLNSGTIFGPVQDVRQLFKATLEAIHTKYETDSDQFYFANIFGEQEYARLTHKPQLLEQTKSKPIGIEWNSTDAPLNRIEPQLSPENRTEYHVGIDYTSSAFQTVAFYKQFLVFMRPVDAWKSGDLLEQYPQKSRGPHSMWLPDDVRSSRPPFYPPATDDMATSTRSWADVELLYNTVTRQIPVLVHFTGQGEKQLRKLWWQRLWFQNQSQQLRPAAQKLVDDQISKDPIHGLTWYNAEMQNAHDIAFRGKGGAWSDDGGWLSWNKLCQSHEKDLYEVMNEDFYHAPPRKDVPKAEAEESSDR